MTLTHKQKAALIIILLAFSITNLYINHMFNEINTACQNTNCTNLCYTCEGYCTHTQECNDCCPGEVGVSRQRCFCPWSDD